jgi:putative redox protein
VTNASITWIENMQFVARGDSGHAVVLDAAAEGGFDSAARPMELLLMGALGCTAMDVISILKKKRQPIEGFRVFAKGERAEEHPKRFTKIHFEYVAYGDVDPAALARAIELSETKYCPAMGTLRGNVELTSSYRVVAKEGDES